MGQSQGRTLQMVGGGKMGQALVGGLLEAGWADPAELTIVEVLAEQRDRLTDELPGVNVVADPLADPGVDTVLAVKPHYVVDVCGGLTAPGRVISIAAGITIATIEAALPAGTPVIRVMPNTPALVGAGVSGLAPGTNAADADLEWAVEVLGAVGETVVVTEAQLDAVTGMSGSGPAYIFLVAEAMTDAGVRYGLPRPIAAKLAVNTINGAGRLMTETGTDPVELRAAVTTPAGTTAAGLAALEDHGLRAAFSAAVGAATDRSIELGRG
ncbi:MAG: pyrroline-5-carboxylate reductase [Acidimicrobiia bacterium]|nr:pyrroline-5-carboxylate reductase [Acidimicrobiia bacterium]